MTLSPIRDILRNLREIQDQLLIQNRKLYNETWNKMANSIDTDKHPKPRTNLKEHNGRELSKPQEIEAASADSGGRSSE